MLQKYYDRKGSVEKIMVVGLKGLAAKTNWLAVNRQSQSNSDSDSDSLFSFLSIPTLHLHHDSYLETLLHLRFTLRFDWFSVKLRSRSIWVNFIMCLIQPELQLLTSVITFLAGTFLLSCDLSHAAPLLLVTDANVLEWAIYKALTRCQKETNSF
jgi:hypothetical protein